MSREDYQTRTPQSTGILKKVLKVFEGFK